MTDREQRTDRRRHKARSQPSMASRLARPAPGYSWRYAWVIDLVDYEWMLPMVAEGDSVPTGRGRACRRKPRAECRRRRSVMKLESRRAGAGRIAWDLPPRSCVLRGALASPAGDEPLWPHIGGAEHGSLGGVEAGKRGSRIHHEPPDGNDLVPSKRELGDHVGGDAVLDLEHSGLERVGTEAFMIVERVEARHLER